MRTKKLRLQQLIEDSLKLLKKMEQAEAEIYEVIQPKFEEAGFDDKKDPHGRRKSKRKR